MKKNLFFGLLAACVCVVFTFGFSQTATSAELTYANFFPPTHIQSKLAEEWCNEVGKRTNGDVTVKYFFGGTLVKAPQTYDAIVTGLADIGMTVLAYTKGRFPVMEAVDLPLGYSSGVQATKVANAVLNKFNPKEFNDTKVMFVHAHGPGLFHTRKTAINSMNDLKGLKIRSTGNSALVAKALGATPVPKSMRESYQMLQKGVVDGSVHPLESNKGWKLGEVVHNVVESYSVAYTTCFGVWMNKDKWNKISPKSQKIILALNKEFIAKHGEAWDASDEAGLAFFKKQGGKITSLSDAESAKWAEAVQPVFASYVDKVKAKGINGQEVIDFIKKAMK